MPHWADAVAAGGEPGGKQRDDGEDERGEGEGDGIERADFVKHAAQDFSGGGGEEEDEDDAAEEHDRAFAHDHAQDYAGPRAEVHVGAGLASAGDALPLAYPIFQSRLIPVAVSIPARFRPGTFPNR